MQIPDLLLGSLFPVVWWITEQTKKNELTAKIAPVVWNVVISVAIVTVYYLIPQSAQNYILTVAIPIGTSALFYEGRKVSNAASDPTTVVNTPMAVMPNTTPIENPENSATLTGV